MMDLLTMKFTKLRRSTEVEKSIPQQGALDLAKPKREVAYEDVLDVFYCVQFTWRLVLKKLGENILHAPQDPKAVLRQPEVRSFQLNFDAMEKDKVLETYVPYIVEEARFIAAEKNTVKLFTVDHDGLYESLGDAWRPVYFDHPSTFDTLALDPKLKKTILDDVDGFVKRKEFYKSVGKVWKRGYLLYGPPGTGKSSLIAAMANYLNFDIFNMDLTDLDVNSELRKLMVATANRYILVIEDIDCSINLQNREEEDEDRVLQRRSRRQLTFSGALNFVDRLWSSSGDERIIIVTTNYKEKLDPALLRAGRMDMHIHLSYCTPPVFDILALNYLKMDHHPHFEYIKQLIENVEVTPGDIAEKFMKNDRPDVVLQELVDFLEGRIQQDEARAKEINGEEEKQTKGKVKSSRDEDLLARDGTGDDDDTNDNKV